MCIITNQVLLIMIMSISPLVFATTLQNFPLAKPGCVVDKCGDINIPYPFGTTESCYRNGSFWVTCNEKSTPPQLYMWDSSVQITEISVAGQLKVMHFVAKTCYADGTLMDSNDGNLRLPYLFTINNTANKFTVVGCDSYGYINGYRGWDQYYSTGCISRCEKLEDIEEGSCMGIGCCQTSGIPQYIWSANVTVDSFDNFTMVSNISNCTYGFVVEDNAFKFSKDNLTNLGNVERLPVVVDWVIAKETCALAQKNMSSYACISRNSKCSEPIHGAGYICECEAGYEGNPYLSDGCKDIDECSSTELNYCSHFSKCNNIPGYFTCECPKSYIGNGTGERGCYCPDGYHDGGERIHEGGCIRNQITGIYKPISGAALGVILVLLFSYLLHLVLKKRRSNKMKQMYFFKNGGLLLQEKLTARDRTMSTSTEREMSSRSETGKVFSSTELERATNNFHSSKVVGQGGFGTVYKGHLDDNRIVAIKKSKEVDRSQIEQFINEVVVLSRINHRNVVKLLGCCLETPVQLLVYEFINNGTLYEHIHDPTKKRFLNWNLRLKIATGTAEVLSYLHSAASTPIIHRDVKSANILLDLNFEAKVSDFGASRLVPMDQTQLSTMVQGTFGYLDPEYMQTNQLTEKSDVYSFGVVLLELLMGVKPLSYDRPEEERSLANFFLRKLKQGRLFEVLDETIVCENVTTEQVSEFAKLAQVCLNLKGQDRPTMKQLAMELEGLRTSGNLKHSSVKFEENVDLELFPGDGYTTTTAYDSYRDHKKSISGGR